jgi:antitoxin CptB
MESKSRCNTKNEIKPMARAMTPNDTHGPPSNDRHPRDTAASHRYMKRRARHRPGFWRSSDAQFVSEKGFGMTGSARTSAGLDERRRRLLYRAWHRGTREMDLIMGRFADAAVAELTEAEIAELERLAEVPDPELYAWLTGGQPVPDAYDLTVFRRLREFHALRPIE